MKSILRYLVFGALLIESCYGRSQQADTWGRSYEAAIPFELSDGYLIVVEGRIERLGKLRFVLDTGATRSVVDRKIADRLRVPRRQGNRVLSFDKTAELEQTDFQDLQFGPVRLANVSMLVADLPRFSAFGRDVDALIGMDLLRMRNFAIDYDARKVWFSSLDQAAFGAVPESDPLFFTVRILIQEHPVHLVVDSGAEGILLYEDMLLQDVPHVKIEGRTKPANLGGRLRAKWATLPHVRIGTTDRDTNVLLMNSSPGHILRGIDGYIGTASLGARWVQFNFTNKTLTFGR